LKPSKGKEERQRQNTEAIIQRMNNSALMVSIPGASSTPNPVILYFPL